MYFLNHRELLGEMARLAYETVREMMAAAVDVPDATPGVVGVIQTFSIANLLIQPILEGETTRIVGPRR